MFFLLLYCFLDFLDSFPFIKMLIRHKLWYIDLHAEEEQNVANQIMTEKWEVEQKKWECWGVSQAFTLVKQKIKHEAQEVILGEREEVSGVVQAAQIQGYRNELFWAQ